jgi:hypothetical protein
VQGESQVALGDSTHMDAISNNFWQLYVLRTCGDAITHKL